MKTNFSKDDYKLLNKVLANIESKPVFLSGCKASKKANPSQTSTKSTT